MPILTNTNHQPKNILYNDKKQILTWDPPTDRSQLVGYTIHWCTASFEESNFQICDPRKKKTINELTSLHPKFRFKQPQTFSNIGVAARYKDKTGGGIQWWKWNFNKNTDPTGAGISYYTAPIGVSIIIALFIYCYQKCRICNDIKVILPEGLEHKPNIIHPPPAHDPVVIRGNFSPEAVMDINRLMPPKETRIKTEFKEDGMNSLTAPGPDKNSANTQIASGSYSKCPEISLDINNIATNTGSYSSCPETCPQSGNSIASGYSTLSVKSLGLLTQSPERSFENDTSISTETYSTNDPQLK